MIQICGNGISNFLVQQAAINKDDNTLKTIGYGKNEGKGKPLGK